MPRRQECSGILPKDDTLLFSRNGKQEKALLPKIALSTQSTEVTGLLDGSRKFVERSAKVLTRVSEHPLLECLSVRQAFVERSDVFPGLVKDDSCLQHRYSAGIVTENRKVQRSYRNSYLLQVDSYLTSESESLVRVAPESQPCTLDDNTTQLKKSQKGGVLQKEIQRSCCERRIEHHAQRVSDVLPEPNRTCNKCNRGNFKYVKGDERAFCNCGVSQRNSECNCLTGEREHGKGNHINFFKNSQPSFDEIATTLKEICDELELFNKRLIINESDRRSLSEDIQNLPTSTETRRGKCEIEFKSLIDETNEIILRHSTPNGCTDTSKPVGGTSCCPPFKEVSKNYGNITTEVYDCEIKEWVCAMEKRNVCNISAQTKDFNGIREICNSDGNGFPEYFNNSLEKNGACSAIIPELNLAEFKEMNSSLENKLSKSLSLPTSPGSFQSAGVLKPLIPSYLTLGRKGAIKQMSQAEISPFEASVRRDHKIDLEELEKIRTIIAGLDLAKYRRRAPNSGKDIDSYGHNSLKRSLSAQPKLSLEKTPVKKCFLDSIPPPPRSPSFLKDNVVDVITSTKHYMSEPLSDRPTLKEFSLELVPTSKSAKVRPVNSKLRELTEKLKPSSAPPSPHKKSKLTTPFTAPATSDFTFWKDPLPVVQPNHFTFTNVCEVSKHQDKECKNTSFYSDDKNDTLDMPFKITESIGSATLPRLKCPSYSRHQRSLSPSLNSLDSHFLLSTRDDESSGILRSFSADAQNDCPQESFFHESKSPYDMSELKRKKLLTLSGASNFQTPSLSAKGFISCKRADSNVQPQIKENIEKTCETWPEIPTETRISPREKRLVCEINSGTIERCNPIPLGINRNHHLNFPESGKEDDNQLYEKNPRTNVNSDVLTEGKRIESASKEKHFSNCVTEKNESEFSKCFLQYQSEPEVKHANPRHVTEGNAQANGIQNFRLNLCCREAIPHQTKNSVNEGVTESTIGLDNTPLSAPVFGAKRHEPFGPAKLEIRPRTMSTSASSQQDEQPKRYCKKKLRGPYGEMLEEEMKKSVSKQRPSYVEELDFLKDYSEKKSSTSVDVGTKSHTLLRSSSHSLDDPHGMGVEDSDLSSPKRKTSANIPLMVCKDDGASLRVPSSSVSGTVSEPSLHVRSHSVGSNELKRGENWNADDLIYQLLRDVRFQDTRTHVVSELYETENSYVESLQIIINKYMLPLKKPELSGIIESSLVDEIFYQVPEILNHHEAFLEIMKQRLSRWDTKQKIGDVFIEVFTRPSLVEAYTAFIRNWKLAKEAIKSASQAKPAFAKFLENTSREHKGKLTLDALLIMPVQRIPRYELLIKELIKHTPADHPDRTHLFQAQREVHDLAININKVEKEALHQEKLLGKIKEVEYHVEGATNLVDGERYFLRRDIVVVTEGGVKRDRCFFLLSDLLLITTVKRKSTAVRKTSQAVTSPYGPLDLNKYKLLLRLSLHDIEVVKKIDEFSCKKCVSEMKHIEDDVAAIGMIGDIVGALHSSHPILDNAVKDVMSTLSKTLVDKQTESTKYMTLELCIRNKYESLPVSFSTVELRMAWEACFNEAREKLALYSRKCLPPEFIYPIPIRKTRAGLQITCAVPAVGSSPNEFPDVWICNSDGYVGQICILTLEPEPSVTSCVSVSNTRIICTTPVSGISPGQYLLRRRSTLLPHLPHLKMVEWSSEDSDQPKPSSFQFDSDSSEGEDFIDSEDDRCHESYADEKEEDSDYCQSTMWLGTEDGSIYIYNYGDQNLKKSKSKLQHPAAVYDIVHIENRIFVSLANGEMIIYNRDVVGNWNTRNPQRVQAASTVAPILKMLLILGKLWCGTFNAVAIFSICSLSVEHTFQITTDLAKPFLTMVSSGQGVLVAMQNSSVIKMFNALTYIEILHIDVAPTVIRMLNAFDEIIRRHKSACLRVTALHVCKDLLWIGTSAGILLTLSVSNISHLTSQIDTIPNLTGISQGHTGHVRFITSVEKSVSCFDTSSMQSQPQDISVRMKEHKLNIPAPSSTESVMVISGGDGYEDFSHMTFSEVAGRDDSTNHLLLWKV